MRGAAAASPVAHNKHLAAFQVSALQKLQEFFRGVRGDGVKRLLETLAIIEKLLANHSFPPCLDYSSSGHEGQVLRGSRHRTIGALTHRVIEPLGDLLLVICEFPISAVAGRFEDLRAFSHGLASRR